MDPSIVGMLDLVKEYGLWPVVVVVVAWRLSPVVLDGLKAIAAAVTGFQDRLVEALSHQSERVIDRLDQQAAVIAENTGAVRELSGRIQSLRSANGGGA